MVNDLSVAELTPPPGGAPRVEILLEDIDPAVEFVTITRTVGNRTMDVRGAILRPVTGALSVVDRAVPFNRSVQYRAELFNSSSVSIGYSSPAVLASLPSEDSWMHNELDPDGAVKVEFLSTAAASISRPVPGETVRPRGRRMGVLMTEPRQGVSGLVLDVFCPDLESADRVQAFLGDEEDTTVPVICVRLGSKVSGMRLPQPLFLGVLDIPEQGVNLRAGGTRTIQRITGDEAAPPAPGVFIPLLTRADLNAYYATRAALNADHASRFDVNRFYEIAGFADA